MSQPACLPACPPIPQLSKENCDTTPVWWSGGKNKHTKNRMLAFFAAQQPTYRCFIVTATTATTIALRCHFLFWFVCGFISADRYPNPSGRVIRSYEAILLLG